MTAFGTDHHESIETLCPSLTTPAESSTIKKLASHPFWAKSKTNANNMFVVDCAAAAVKKQHLAAHDTAPLSRLLQEMYLTDDIISQRGNLMDPSPFWCPPFWWSAEAGSGGAREARGEDECQKTLCQRQGGALGVPVQPRQRLRAGTIVEVVRVCVCVCVKWVCRCYVCVCVSALSSDISGYLTTLPSIIKWNISSWLTTQVAGMWNHTL